jgi:glycosyltransferase involved in cell wall biosynthesis
MMQRRPIKICFISLNAYPLFEKSQVGVQGGAEVDTYMIATELAGDNGFDVHFITGDFGQPDRVNFENVKIYKTVNLISPLRSVLSIWRALKKTNCDIYFKKGASLVTTFVALYCRIYHKPFILRTSHQSECDGSYICSQFLKGRAFKWVLKTAKQVIVQNAQDCESLFRTTGIRSIAIPNGHRITNSFAGGREWILWVGRSIAFKKPELFVKLAQEFPLEQFVMICQWAKGDQNFNKSFEQNKLMGQTQKVPNLKLIDHVPFHQIDTYFRQAKLFVNTSDTEGFPNTFIQACKCKTPILSFNVNPDNFLAQYKCGMCANGDWQSFKDMLKQLLDPVTALEYGTSGYQYVREKHDITKIVEQYKGLFRNLNTIQ